MTFLFTVDSIPGDYGFDPLGLGNMFASTFLEEYPGTYEKTVIFRICSLL